MVQQATGGGHQDVHAAAQGRDLGVDADAAENHRSLEVRQVAPVGLDVAGDLGRQFTRRHQHQRADPAAALYGRGGEPLQHGQGEGSGLAGARLGACQHIAAFQHDRDRLGLNGSRCGIPFFADCAKKLGLEAERIK